MSSAAQTHSCTSGHSWASHLGGACPTCGGQALVQTRSPHDHFATVFAPTATLVSQPGTPSGPARPKGVADLPGYEILAELGRGGMGVVYKAKQLALGRVVAVKMILAAEHAGPESCRRFRIEAEAVARLHDPGIVQVYEVGESNGRPFFSLEFAEGGSLAGKLHGNPWPPRRAAEIVEKLARAMHHAHERGIIHRDLKPANVLFTRDGQPKITDFGLAKRLDANEALSQSGDVMGTPSYMAPEQAMGKVKEIGPAADIYALGGILYELLTGRPPFKGATVIETIDFVRHREPLPPSQLTKVPPDLENICLKCLHKSPTSRYASAAELADDLRRFLNNEPVKARPVSRLERTWRWCQRNRAVASLLAAVALSLLGGIIVSVSYGIKASTQATLAQEREKKATELAASEKEQRDLADSRFSLAQMMRVSNMWEKAPTFSRTLLNDPIACPPDQRDYPWKLFDRACTGEIYSGTAGQTLCFGPDNDTLLVGDRRQHTIRRIDLRTGKDLAPFAGHPVEGPAGEEGSVSLLMLSKDGKTLYSGGADRTIKQWDATTGQLQRTLTGHTGVPNNLAFSSDGTTAASVSRGGEIVSWDMVKGTSYDRRLVNGGATSVAVEPNGDVLVGAPSGMESHNVSAVKNAPPVTDGGMRVILGFIKTITVPNEGESLPVRDDGTIFCWGRGGIHTLDLATLGRKTNTYDKVDGTHLTLSKDGSLLVCGGEEGAVRVLDLASGRVRLELHGNSARIRRVAISGDGLRIAGLGIDGSLKVWDVRRLGGWTDLKSNLANSAFAAVANDGRTLAVGEVSPGARGGGVIRVCDVKTGQRFQFNTERDSFPQQQLLFSPDGKLLVHVSRISVNLAMTIDRAITRYHVYDVASGQKVASLPECKGGLFHAAFSGDGRRIATSGKTETRVFDTDGFKPVTVIPEPSQKVTLSPDGSILATVGNGKGARLWDATTGKSVGTVLPGDEVLALAFSPDSKTIALSGTDRLLHIWDTQQVTPLFTLPSDRKQAHALSVTHALAFSKDSKTLIATSWSTVRFWDLGQRVERAHLEGQTVLCFSPDQQSFVTLLPDGQYRLWTTQPHPSGME